MFLETYIYPKFTVLLIFEIMIENTNLIFIAVLLFFALLLIGQLLILGVAIKKSKK
jgi:hypothetical protein